MRLRTFAILAAALLILASGAAVWSQTVQGVVTGTVTDPTGAVVPGATVTITNAGTNISQSTATGSDGSYRFPLVPPGTYTVEIKAANFSTVRISGVVVEASQTVPLNHQLELAKAQQIIEVTSQAPLVQTATSDLGFQVDSSTIQHAALVDRDVFDVLPFMAPQVSMGLDMTPTSGGAREAGTSYMLNGAEDNNNFSAGALNINPPLESVEDFSIITNSMGAQYGRGMGAVVSANQKSGTNKFHGALYEQNRNATLNANDFFYNRDFPVGTRPKYIKNQFGGAIGGPIKKDKTFFFFTYDRLKLLTDSTSANNFEPTNAALANFKTHATANALKMLGNYPPVTSDSKCPGQPDPLTTGFPVGCVSFTDPQTTTNNAYYGRVDHNFSNSDRLSFAANVNRNLFLDEFGGGGLLSNGSGAIAGIPNTVTLNNHNLALTETHTFSPRVANELTFSHNRFFNPSIEGNPANQKAPLIIIDNKLEGGLGYSFGPFEGGQVVGFVQDRWALQDNLIWTVGRHALKIGGSANYGILYRNWDLGLPGEYEFGELTSTSSVATPSACPAGTTILPSCDGTLQPDGTITGLSSKRVTVTSFAGDYPYFEETSVDPRIPAPNKADAYRHYTSHDYAVFGQDDWKVTNRLTLNLGLRWERFGAPSEVHGITAQLTNFAGCNWATNAACIAAAVAGPVSRMWKTQNHDFGPRIGFAWDPMGKGKMAVRGGYGIFYDRIFDNIWSNGAWNPPFYALLDFSADGGDAIFYSNPASIGAGYNPAGPCGPIPYAPGEPAGCTSRKRVSTRFMDVSMHDSSGQNFYLGVERQFFGGLLLSVKYQGAFGRHLPMLEYVNRVDGDGYNSSLTPVRPNGIFAAFNYRSNSVSSNYNALIAEAKKNMGHGLQFDTSYTFSKALDVNSELFAGCSTIGGQSAPYYYISNALPRLSYGRGAEDHRHAYKFNVTYELPFLKTEKGIVGHALGGWSLGSFFQLYSGHPIDVFDGRGPFGSSVLDPNGIPYNIGGDYNLDRVGNDHPIFVGNMNSVYSNGSPANGIFTDNNIIGCGFQGMPSTIPAADITACNNNFGVGTPNSLFIAPPYPGSGALYKRYGTLGRDFFHGPRFVDLDFGLHKTFKLTESMNLRFSAEAQNLANHPNFDAIDASLGSSTFGQAQIVDGGAGLPTQKSRVMSLSLRLAF
ncbi:MAG TPA: TonB-dependent receptor [Candidatus Acidoferrum sp.]|nr:TonB-dependent receptor [Candidatus Acidoferrum sp.]